MSSFLIFFLEFSYTNNCKYLTLRERMVEVSETNLVFLRKLLFVKLCVILEASVPFRGCMKFKNQILNYSSDYNIIHIHMFTSS